MMEQHWLSIMAAVFLIGMMLYGHYRGFLRLCVSVGALLLTVMVVRVGTPYVTGFIRDNPSIRQNVAQMILDSAGWEEPDTEQFQVPAAQRMAIERLKLPESVKSGLLENNNGEFYDFLGVSQFADYVSTYLADILINAAGSVLLFLTAFLAIHVAVRWLNLISRLPIIHGLNKMAGAFLGLAYGLLLLWVGALAVKLFSTTPLGQELQAQIYQSTWLTLLYQYNMIEIALKSILGL